MLPYFRVFLLACGVLAVPALGAQVSLTVNIDQPQFEMAPTMYGIFFEDINFAADGGIYAELVKNRSFEFDRPLMGWKTEARGGAAGAVLIENRQAESPNNPRYARVKVEAESGTFVMTNEGFRGMGIHGGATYDFSVLAHPVNGNVEGRDLVNRYQWKKTVGDVEDRKLIVNRWNTEFAAPRNAPDYYQSYGLGFYEYFLLSEDLGATPLPILNCGMARQFNTGEVVALDELDPYIQDALDLIECANGDATTKWGPQYIERYKEFAEALTGQDSLYAGAVLDTVGLQVIVKVVNAASVSREFQLDLPGKTGTTAARLTALTAGDPMTYNSVVEENIRPRTKSLGEVNNKLSLTLAPASVNVITVDLR